MSNNAERGIHCPKCGQRMEISLKESIEPYSMTIRLVPDSGRTIDAKTVAGAISNFTDMFCAVGKTIGHKTQCTVLGVSVDDDLATTIRISAIPLSPDDKKGNEK